MGKVQLDGDGLPFFKPHIPLLPRDYLRVGYEDENWHATLPVRRSTPKAGSLRLSLPKHKTPGAGTPVFLIDRREPELEALIKEWQGRLEACAGRQPKAVNFVPRLPAPSRPRKRPDMILRPGLPLGADNKRSRRAVNAVWLSPKTAREVSRTVAADMAWWLPPVIWPDEEDLWQRLLREVRRNGARHFVCNAPWQAALFEGEADLIAGPFCNAGNALTLAALASLGFGAAFASPELSGEDLLALPGQSPLPLGLVISGFWPMGLARHEVPGLKTSEPFQSPKGETFWTRRYGQNLWVYPAWPLDLSARRAELQTAGYAFFAQMEETPPKNMPAQNRPGLFNWEGGLL